MRDIRVNGHRIRMYDDIETLPVVRFHKYNKMLLLDAGIGSDLSDFAAHVQRAKHFARKGDDNALTELDNLLQNVMLIQQELSPRHLAFAVLVAEVDGVACGDLSDEGLRRTLERVQEISNAELTAELQSAKKKIDGELTAYFPEMFDSPEAKEYGDNVARRAELILQEITGGVDNSGKIAAITGRMMDASRPKRFGADGNAEVAHDKSFGSMCLLMSQELHADAKKMTVLEFYTANEYLERLSKERKKILNNGRRK